jgi:SnoaL-like domain
MRTVMSNLTADQRRTIEWECSRLVNLYANLNDAANWEALADLYTLDGAMARPSAPAVLIKGRVAILESFLARPPRTTRHICANLVVDVDSPTAAHGESAMLLFSGPDAPKVGSFHDRFTLTSEGWRFAERRGLLHFPGGSK